MRDGVGDGEFFSGRIGRADGVSDAGAFGDGGGRRYAHRQRRRRIVVGDIECDAVAAGGAAGEIGAGIRVQGRQVDRERFRVALVEVVRSGRENKRGFRSGWRGGAGESDRGRAAEGGVSDAGGQAGGRGEGIVGAERGGAANRKRQGEHFARHEAAANLDGDGFAAARLVHITRPADGHLDEGGVVVVDGDGRRARAGTDGVAGACVERDGERAVALVGGVGERFDLKIEAGDAGGERQGFRAEVVGIDEGAHLADRQADRQFGLRLARDADGVCGGGAFGERGVGAGDADFGSVVVVGDAETYRRLISFELDTTVKVRAGIDAIDRRVHRDADGFIRFVERIGRG